MGEVIDFKSVRHSDSSPNSILDAARDKLQSVVILGYDTDGNEYFTTNMDCCNLLWLLNRCKHELLSAAASLEDAG